MTTVLTIKDNPSAWKKPAGTREQTRNGGPAAIGEKAQYQVRQAALNRKLEEVAGSSRHREDLMIEAAADPLDQGDIEHRS
jgi:hypothetical protein